MKYIKTIAFYSVFCLTILLPANLYAVDWLALAMEVAEADPRVLSAKANLRASHAELKGALGVYYPSIRGTGYFGSVDNNDPLVREGEKSSWGAEIKQSIPVFGKEKAIIKNAKAAVKSEEAFLNKIKLEAVADFFETALRLKAAVQLLELSKELEALLARQYKAIQTAVSLGGAALPNLHQAKSRFNQALADKKQTEAEVDFLRNRMQRMLAGKPKPQLITNYEIKRLQKSLTPLTYKDALKIGKKFSFLLLKAKAELEIAEAELAEAKSNYFPALSLNLQTEQGKFGAESANSVKTFINIEQPLFSGGKIKSQRRSAEHKKNAAFETLKYQKVMLRERIKNAWAGWKAYQESSALWGKAEGYEKNALKLTKEQVNKGMGTRITLMKAMEDKTKILKQGIEKRLERDLAWLNLIKEIGALKRLE